MTNDVSRVYLFLAKYNESGQTWQSAADSNGDGTVIKSEFRAFMEDNFEWDGETSEAGKNDLINAFWQNIDTNRSTSKIKGTKFKNANALDKDEVASMENRITMYEILNEYTSTLNAPSVVSSASEWKKSVTEGLSALVETYIKEGKSSEELLAYLEESAPLIMNKATADYCATEYMSSVMSEIVNEYGYAYASDTTLQDMINNYVQSLTGEENADTIKSTVTGIVDAYMATAGLAEENSVDLSQYGYNITENSALNELQKSVVKKKLEDNLEAIKEEADYNNYSEIYDNAVNEYITTTLSNAKFSDFEAIQDLGIEDFKATKQYQNIETTIDVKTALQGDELYNILKESVSESFANKIKNDGRYFEAYTQVQEKAVEKAIDGDFNVDGALDTTALINWVAEELAKNLSNFYENGLGDMPINDLNIMYDQLAAAAAKESDDTESLAQSRQAAIQYCDVITAKNSPQLSEAVKEIFGDDYASAINQLYPSEITEKMTELKAKAVEIGDVSEFTVSSWSGLPADNTVIGLNSTEKYNISATLDTMGSTQARQISYSLVSVSGGTATCSELGELTITGGSTSGYITVKVAVLADGVTVGTKTVSLQCKATASSIVNNIGSDSWGGSSEHLEVYGLLGVSDGKTQVTSQSFTDLYNNNAVIMLHRDNNNDTETDLVKGRLKELCGYIVNALSSQGLDKYKLVSAANEVIDSLMSNYYLKGTSKDNTEKEALGTRVSDKIKNGEMDGVVKFTDKKRKDYQVNMVSFKELVDLILNAYGI